MRGNNRKSIEKCRKKLPQFTTMNVIDGQAGLVIYSSLIFYSLTIDNILNIIVLIILAGISIAAITGDEGIIKKGDKAKEETEISTYKEQLEVIKHGEYADGYTLSVDAFLDKYAKAVQEDKMFKEAREVTADHENKIVIVVTKEGYRFEVTIEETTYVGNEDGEGNTEVDISKVKISITSSPENWTNGKVKVKITSNVTKVSKEYSIDGGKNWNKYENEIEVADNGTEIQARGVNEKNEKTEVVKKKIENIDRLAPNIFAPTVKTTKNRLEITASTTDKEATTKDGKSGIKGYKFSKDNGSNWTGLITEGRYTYDNLQSGTTYPIKVKAIDNAGNETETTTINGTTEEEIILPNPAEKIQITKTPTNWTNGAVTVRMTNTATDYRIQYSKDNRSWQMYTGDIIVENNNETIYARLYNADRKQATESINTQITNIDRLQPNISAPILVEGIDTIKITVTATDKEATGTDGKSEIKGYKFSKDGGNSWTEEQTSNVYTFGRLTPGASYRIKVKAIDNAGNEIDTQEVTGTTEAIPGGNNNIYFNYSPSEWTNGNVTVTITAPAGNYQLQYSKDGSTWNNYNSQTKVEMTENGPIYARLAYGENYGVTATGNVSNIDRILPTGSGTVSVTSQDAKEAIIKITATDANSGIVSITNKTTEFITKENDTTYKVTKNGLYNFQIKDKANNIANIDINVNKVLPSTADTDPFLPDGSEVLEDDLNKGVVIKDSNGNEWTWIEVPKSIYTNTAYNGGTAPISSTDYAKIESTMQKYAEDYRRSGYTDEWYSEEQHGFASATEYNNHKNTMLKSVYENGGFYIGRYEAGTNTLRTSADAPLITPVIKEGAYPYNYVTNKQAQTKSKELATGGKTSSLMFGIQWDLVLKHIENKQGKTQSELKNDSTTWGNYYNATFEITKGKYSTDYGKTFTEVTGTYTKPASSYVLLTTGATERNSTLNIYDLAGNEWEWTLEKSTEISYLNVLRGGHYSKDGAYYQASSREGRNSSSSGDLLSFHPALW